jgi:TP901 family phage tail tape measure protein
VAIIIPIIADARGLITGTVAAERGLTRLGRNTQKLGRSMTRNLTLPLVVLGAAAVKGFADFDKAITESTSIMGDVSEETRDRMTKAAREVATTLGISHKNAAESYFFLASAGLDAEQSIAALPQVALFAKAGMFDMATATDLATDAQSALGLTSKNAQKNLKNLGRVTDVFVKANTMANASVEEFATAMTSKAGVALRNLGISIEEGTAVLALFADQGIKGERAGTLLTRTLQGLEEQSRKNAKAFEAAGISVFDAQGNFRNLADITEDITKATKGMTVEQKSAFIAQLGFNKLSREGVLALLGNADAIRKYEAGLKLAAGFTAKVAAKQLETFAEQVNLMKTQLMDVAIDVAPVILNDFLIPLVDLIKRATAAFKELSPQTKELVTRGLMITAALGPVLIILGKLVVVGGALVPVVRALAGAVGLLNAAFLFSPIGLVVIAVVALGAALFLAYQRSEAFRRAVDDLAIVARNTLGVAIEFVKRKLDEWGPAIQGAWSSIRPILVLIGKLILVDVITRVRLAAAVIGALPRAFEALGKVAQKVLDLVGKDVALLVLGQMFPLLRVVQAIDRAFKLFGTTVTDVLNRIKGPIDTANKELDRIINPRSRSSKITPFQSIKDAAKKNIQDAVAKATQEARKNLATLGGQLGSLVSELIGVRDPRSAEAKEIRDRLKREADARDQARLQAAVDNAETNQDRIDAQRELDDFLAEKIAERLEGEVAASQSAAQRQIDDLIAEFNRGEMSAQDFQTQLDGIIGAGPGADMGRAFAEAFGLALKSLTNQMEKLGGITGVISPEGGVRVGAAGEAERKKALVAAQKRFKELRAKQKELAAQEKIANDPKKSQKERDAAQKKINQLRKEINSLKSKLPDEGKRPPNITDFDKKALGVAQGGILKQTVFAAGEAGPEAIIPLGSRGGAKILRDAFFGNGMGANGSGGSTYNITVNAGLGTNPDELSRVIVESIKRYERRNGQVFQGPLVARTTTSSGVISTASDDTTFTTLVSRSSF